MREEGEDESGEIERREALKNRPIFHYEVDSVCISIDFCDHRTRHRKPVTREAGAKSADRERKAREESRPGRETETKRGAQRRTRYADREESRFCPYFFC